MLKNQEKDQNFDDKLNDLLKEDENEENQLEQ